MAGALRVLRELAPVWWIARAYVAAAVIALLAGSSWSISHPEVPLYGGPVLGTAVLLALAAASVWLGIRGRRGPAAGRGRTSIVALNLLLAVAAVPVAAHIANHGARVSYIPYDAGVGSVGPPAARELSYRGGRVENIYPYGRNGRLLQDVRLFDSAGRPINIGGPQPRDPLRRTLVTSLGTPVFNSFPIRYFEPHSRRVAHPTAGTRPRVSAIATRPLAPGGAAVGHAPSAAFPSRAVGGASSTAP